jgi:hypothetical protein
MKTTLLRLCAGAACAVSAVCAQEAAFYRILSPAGSGITDFSAAGAIIAWTNAAAAGVTCTVQRASSLAPADWRDHVRHEATNTAVRLRLDDPAAPAGMAYIPAGSFEMGIDEESAYNLTEAPVHWVFVSAFYMAKTEVTWAQWSAVRAWAVTNGYAFDNAGGGKAADHPVHMVNWLTPSSGATRAARWRGCGLLLHGRVQVAGLPHGTGRADRGVACGRLPAADRGRVGEGRARRPGRSAFPARRHHHARRREFLQRRRLRKLRFQ